MKNSLLVLGLGVLALVVGGAMYAIDYHRTIGLGGVGLGVLLILGGVAMTRMEKKPVMTPATPK
ncbi:MAG: hypothetical protein OK422_00190 [Thaumarchaeota archaeon]|nr:hypothetical protein [Nitrososphaerota archaeon]